MHHFLSFPVNCTHKTLKQFCCLTSGLQTGHEIQIYSTYKELASFKSIIQYSKDNKLHVVLQPTLGQLRFEEALHMLHVTRPPFGYSNFGRKEQVAVNTS